MNKSNNITVSGNRRFRSLLIGKGGRLSEKWCNSHISQSSLRVREGKARESSPLRARPCFPERQKALGEEDLVSSTFSQLEPLRHIDFIEVRPFCFPTKCLDMPSFNVPRATPDSLIDNLSPSEGSLFVSKSTLSPVINAPKNNPDHIKMRPPYFSAHESCCADL